MNTLPTILNLFDQQQQQIIERLQDENPEAIDQLVDEFFATKDELADKINSWCWVISRLQNEIDYLNQQEKRLAELRKTVENNQQRMKEYLKGVVQQQGGKFSSPDFRLSIRKSQPRVVIDDDKLLGATIPKKYLREVNPIDLIDKKLIRKALENGEAIDFAYLETNSSLTIK